MFYVLTLRDADNPKEIKLAKTQGGLAATSLADRSQICQVEFADQVS